MTSPLQHSSKIVDKDLLKSLYLSTYVLETFEDLETIQKKKQEEIERKLKAKEAARSISET